MQYRASRSFAARLPEDSQCSGLAAKTAVKGAGEKDEFLC